MKMHNPFRNLSKFEWSLWIASLIVVSSTFFLAGDFNILTLIASLIGVTALIFIAKGDVTGQVLTVVFSLFYTVISLQFRYYGEMITYLGMTAPIAILSVISWLKHPYRGAAEVKVHYLTRKQTLLMIILTIVVTFGLLYSCRISYCKFDDQYHIDRHQLFSILFNAVSQSGICTCICG